MRMPALLIAALLPLFAAAAEDAPLPATVDSLQIIDLVEGTGTKARPGSTVVVHYTGWLYDPAAEDGKGKKFDSSVDRGRPFDFPLGAGRVIRGWDAGVAGMSVGGQRRLIIPPKLGYGQRGAGGVIPPDATLLFDVELLDVR
jgi:FKBP-type peptidyl-prolyl cis-trans isomerase FkpA